MPGSRGRCTGRVALSREVGRVLKSHKEHNCIGSKSFPTTKDLAHGLSELLSYEGNIEEDFYLNFQVFQEEMGVVKSYNLKPGGDKIPVNKQNRKEYVQLYIDFLLNKSIYKQFAAFYHGFHSVCASDALM
ncbi:putative E3 ubiquitin-protein ligase HTD2, partial [Ameca splendens]